MKNIIKVIAIAVFTNIGNSAYSQSINLKSGFTTSNIKSLYSENYESSELYNGASYTYTLKNKNKNGYNASIGYEFKLGNRLSLETGFNYQTRGQELHYSSSYRFESENSSESNTIKLRLNYLDLPVVLNTTIKTGEFKIYARTGIYIGMITSGEVKESSEYKTSSGNNSTYESSEKISFSDMEDMRITGGLIGGIGAEYKGFYFETNYATGALSLKNLDEEMFTHDLSFSVGYKVKLNQ